MKLMITGGGGQLAWELERSAPANAEVTCLARADLDITDRDAVLAKFAELKPHTVINAAAYTAVDKAESESERAMAVNGQAVGYLAEACSTHKSYLLQLSTDFVFDGRSNQPYAPADKVNPLNVYGATKLAGERALAKHMQGNWCVLRTSWVHSAHGGNFVKTMLRLMTEKPALTIVSDQIGTPTWAAGLAEVCWQMAEHRVEGKFHWSDSGVASWYDFAIAIQLLGLQKGLLNSAIPIIPVRTTQYPTAAQRPPFSVLDKSQLLDALPTLKPKHWLLQLSRMLDEL